MHNPGKYLLFLGMLLIAPLCIYANAVDSLKSIIDSKNLSGQKRLEAIKNLTGSLCTKDFDAAIQYGNKGIRLATKLNDSISIGFIQNQLGEAQYFKGNYHIAANNFYQSIQTLEHYKRKKELAFTYNNLAKLYRKTRELDLAEKFYDKALQTFIELNDSSGLEMIYNESGVVFEYREDYTNAIKRYTQGYDIGLAIKDSLSIGYSLNNLAGVYTILKDYTKAGNYLAQALHIRERMRDSFAIAMTLSDMGTLHTDKGDYPTAIQNYIASNLIATKLKYLELLSSNYEKLANLATLQNNYRQAYVYKQTAVSLHDSIYSIEKARQIEELNTKYETKQKEQQIFIQQAALDKKNYVIAGMLVVAALGLLVLFSFYKRYKLKQEIHLQSALMKQQQLATKAVLEAEENERQRIGKDLHDGIGQMMSAAKINMLAFREKFIESGGEQPKFENILALIDESCKEVRSVSHNMMPNVLLKAGLASAARDFLNKIDNSIIAIDLYTEGLDTRLDTDIEAVLYRVIQECVNNVIKHAAATRLDISITKDEQGIDATIEDNGNGFDMNNATEGIGLKNIRTRIEYLKGTVEFDSKPGNGTVVTIHIPLASTAI